MKLVLPNDLFYNILDIMIQNYSKNGDNIQEIKEFYSLNKSLKNIVSSKKQAILKAHFRYSKANDKDFYSNIIDLKYFTLHSINIIQ